MIVNILFTLFICLSLIMTFISVIDKKEGYLSIALDMSLMMLLFYWDKEHIIKMALWLIVVLSVYFCIEYFMIIRSTKSKSSIGDLVKKGVRNDLRTYFSLFFIMIPIVVDSYAIMLILLILYAVVDRCLFYQKYKSLI